MKLSEENVNYKKSLRNISTDLVESNDDRSLKREWKEVQLKISETGVMSITDISSTILKRDTAIENLQHRNEAEETVAPVVTVNKIDSLIENCSLSKSSMKGMQTTLIIDAQMTKTPAFTDSNNVSFVTNDIKSTTENSLDKNCTSSDIQHNGNTTRQVHELGNCNVLEKLQQDIQETKDRNQVSNTENSKIALQKQKISSHSIVQSIEENRFDAENMEGTNTSTKKISINNNDSTELKTITQKEYVKNINEIRIGNTGSKIDALSAKLQFQPKIGQVNNTYSKKTPKEKRILQNMKKSDKTSTENIKPANVKVRSNTENITGKVSISSSVTTPLQESIAPAITSRNIPAIDSSLVSDIQADLYEKDNQAQQTQCMNIDVQQALNLLEQRTNSSAQALIETVPRMSHVTNIVNEKLQCTQSSSIITSNENLLSIPSHASTSTMSQAFPYTVQDLVTNSTVKPTLRNSNSGCVLQKLGTLNVPNSSTTASNNQISSISQFSIPPAPSMSIYSIPTSVKNHYSNASQSVNTATATATATATVMVTAITTATSTTTIMSTSMPSGMYSVPPCPDAIPISLMKPTTRKQETAAKGTNINEICAKIGSNTTGSKINDICAKIGENSKEKNRLEARNKSDIPDLLKIAKKSPSPSSNSDTSIKHIPNIPNVPVYTPSGTMTTIENKNTHTNVKDNIKPVLSTSTSGATVTVSTSQVTHQKISSFRKQNQSIGYKTLRDPPKSWNPTLSKNNYIAVKNQAREMQSQMQVSASEGTNKQIASKPAKIFKMRNMPRYLGNPASGVKPMYGNTNDVKEKDQSTTNIKSTTLNMMKIDPKTLSPIVSTVNSPIVSPPPYSPNVRSYQNIPFSRDICRNTGSPISPRNSPVNILSTNPFIPSPTPNTNPRIIYSNFPSSFADASRFPNPLIRSPIGIPPPSAFHSNLPPSINKLYQRSNYMPQTTGYSPVSQPPAVQRIPPSTHSSSPKASKVSSSSNTISSTSFNLGKTESQSPVNTTMDSVALLLSKNTSLAVSNVTLPVNVSVPSQREVNAFNLSKTAGNLANTVSNVSKSSTVDSTEGKKSKQNLSSLSFNSGIIAQNKQCPTASLEIADNPNSLNITERKQGKKNVEAQDVEENIRCKDENDHILKEKLVELKQSIEITDIANLTDQKETNVTKVNGEVTNERFEIKKSKEDNNEEAVTGQTIEQDKQVEQSSSRERNSMLKSNAQTNINDLIEKNEHKNDDIGRSNEQAQGKKSDVQRNKPGM